jgi:hypothetical protein
MTRPFTNFSENNLRVIQNFLLYIQKEAEFGQAAIDYIAEDHVDGESSQEALLERAEASELIREDVFMRDNIFSNDVLDETEPCNIYVDKDLIIYCVNKSTNQVILFGLVGDQDEIASEHRDEILYYCLGSYTKEDDVNLGDIFVHGKYVRPLNK